MIGVLHISVDPVVVHLGALSVHWYGILYAVAFVAGFRFGVPRPLRTNRSEVAKWVAQAAPC